MARRTHGVERFAAVGAGVEVMGLQNATVSMGVSAALTV